MGLSKKWECISFVLARRTLSLLNDFMPRFKPYDYRQDWMVSISFAAQLPEGSLEYAFHHLIEERLSEEWFEDLYANEEIGRPAYSPKLLLVSSGTLAELRFKAAKLRRKVKLTPYLSPRLTPRITPRPTVVDLAAADVLFNCL